MMMNVQIQTRGEQKGEREDMQITADPELNRLCCSMY